MFLAKPYLIDTRVRNEAESLTGAGYKATVLQWDRLGVESGDTSVNGVRIIGLRLLSGLEFSKIGYALSAIMLQFYCVAWCAANMRRRYAVHCNDFNTLLAGVALRFLYPSRVRLVYDCHELTPSAYAEWFGYRIGLVAGALEKMFLRRVDAVITVSPPIQRYLSTLTERPVVVVYNTIKTQSVPQQERRWWRNKLHLEGFVVSYVGMLRQDVGMDELIDAATHFKDSKTPGIKFLIVGYGPDLPRIKARATGLEDYVEFVPRVPHAEALGYVKASDISYAVYRSKGESGNADKRSRLVGGNTIVASPWKIFEAMACGTSVLVRGGTYTWSFVNQLGYGLSAGSGSPQEIIEKLTWALQNQGQVESMSGLGRQHFLDQYNWERMGQKLVSIYDMLVQSYGGPRPTNPPRLRRGDSELEGVRVVPK